MKEKFTPSYLEIASTYESKLLDTLEESVGEKSLFEYYRKLLAQYLKPRSIKTTFLDFVSDHRVKIFVEVDKEDFAYLRDIFVRLKEDKLYKKDKKFFYNLFLNALDKGEHFFVILLSLLTKLYPDELIDGFNDALEIGKNLINVILEGIPDSKIQPLSRLLTKEPFFIGFPGRNLGIRDLERFLARYGFTPSVFVEIHDILIEDFTERESGDIISLFKNSEITNTQSLRNFPFENFFIPSKSVLQTLAKIASGKAANAKKKLMERDRELDEKDMKVREETNKFLQKSLSKLQALIDVKNQDLSAALKRVQEENTKLEETLKLHLRMVQELKDSGGALKDEIDQNRALQGIKPQDFISLLSPASSWEIEKLVLEFWKAQPFLAIVSPSSEKAIIRFLRKTERASKNNQLFSKLSSDQKRVFSPDAKKVIHNYKMVFYEILEVIYVRDIISNMVEIWPPPVDFENPRSRITGDKIIHLVGLDLLPRGKFYRFSKSGKIEPKVDREDVELKERVSKILRKKFSSLVSTLVYDIRGSTFMSHRLRDAERERSILSLFQSNIFKASRKGSSFILKDTGDGGILWFGSNSQKLYRNIYKTSKTRSGSIVRYSTALEDEFNLLPHMKTAEMSIRTALNMVKAAEKFVKENYVKYRGWFGEITEKEIFHEGITYALLPPQFKSLFRLGIGIASGSPGKDLIFTPNAFGDPDLNGILVDEAALLSSGRSPERSVILIDNNTLINLMLNSDDYSLTKPLEKGDSEKEIINKLLYILKAENKERSFFFDGFNVSPVGIYFLDEQDKRKALKFDVPEGLNLTINDGGELEIKKERIKIIYEVLPEEKDEE
jgi:class 3 adenylate cyclase